MSEAQDPIKSNIQTTSAFYMLTISDNDTVTSDDKSECSTAPLLGRSKETVGSKAKALWRQLKEEDEVRKTSIQHVTPEEATVITGHGESGSKSNNKHGKGDKRIAGAFTLF